MTPEAIANLDEYLRNLEKETNGEMPKRLWNNAKNDNLNDWLKALLKKSNIETYDKKVRFHGIRKFVYDVLARMDETVASVVTGKKTDVSKITYRTSIDQECERVFKESYKLFALNGDVSGKAKKEQSDRIAQLENALSHLEKENSAFKVRVDNLQHVTTKLEDRLNNITDLVSEKVEFFGKFSEEEKEAMRNKYGLKAYSSEEKELFRAFNDMAMALQGEKGYMNSEDEKELKKRLRAWLVEHELL